VIKDIAAVLVVMTICLVGWYSQASLNVIVPDPVEDVSYVVDDDAWARHASAMRQLHVPRPTSITPMGPAYRETQMDRRLFMKRLAALPLAAVAVAAGVEAAGPLYPAGSFAGLFPTGRKWFRLYPKDPVLAMDPALRDWLDECEDAILGDLEYNSILTGERITIRSGLPPVAWRKLR